jgi:hypothetical protein
MQNSPMATQYKLFMKNENIKEERLGRAVLKIAQKWLKENGYPNVTPKILKIPEQGR